jgi:uncharacterized protein YeaO (DUF488 family)
MTACRPPADMTRRDKHGFEIRRIYEDGRADHNYRVLVDRLWPRGVKKEEAALDEWVKDVAPSAELRRWYGHETRKFDEFARRYRDELDVPPGSDAFARLRKLGSQHRVILLTATRDVEHSGARVLYEHLLA